jgi:hypothetical protein
MKCSKRSVAVAFVLFAVLLSSTIETLNARDAATATHSIVATQTAKQQCMNACRARYRDCRHKKQVSSFECQNVYQDCTRFSCDAPPPG